MTTHAFVAIRSCGCTAAIIPDDGPVSDRKYPARDLALQYRKAGCAIRRLPIAETRLEKCKHEKGSTP